MCLSCAAASASHLIQLNEAHRPGFVFHFCCPHVADTWGHSEAAMHQHRAFMHCLLLHRPASLVYPPKAAACSALHRPLRDPPHSSVVLRLVGQIERCSLRVGWRRTVRVHQQALDGGQDRANIVAGRPLVLDNVQADCAIPAQQYDVNTSVQTACVSPQLAVGRWATTSKQ